jgi:uncharacterized repeat protein (TIGR01451 family)
MTATPRILRLAIALAIGAPAPAAAEMAINRAVFVERADGAAGREIPRAITPGERLLFVVSYRNRGAEPTPGVVITNPIPSMARFAACEDERVELSVDRARSWGRLETLTVTLPNGATRPATAEDVTHIRWRMAAPIAAGEAGELQFLGIAR